MTKLIRSALYTCAGVLVVAAGISVSEAYNAKTSIDAQTTILLSDRDTLANDEGILLKEHAIRKEISVIDSRTGAHARRIMIERARTQHGITVKDFTLDAGGTQFTMRIMGNYTDIISAAVTIPAKSPGVTMQNIHIEADPEAGDGHATATLTGTFS